MGHISTFKTNLREQAALPLKRKIAKTLHLPSPPSLGLLVAEPLRAAYEYMRTRLRIRSQFREGDGHAVVFFPGLGSDQRYMSRLKEHCQRLGYVCYDWGRGFNRGPEGDVKSWIAQLAMEVEALVGGHSQSITLIGWSLGGIYAREIAKIMKTRVRQVITLGSPLDRIAASTNAAWLYRFLNGTEAPSDKTFCATLASAPPVPTSSIYSRTDGVVAWRSCQVKSGRHAENIEVDSSHLGLVFHRRVFTIVANRLAQRPGEWQPWRNASDNFKTRAIVA